MASSSYSTVLVAAFAALLVLAFGVPQAMGARSLGVVEWPCCRQYDAPPTVTADVDVFLPGLDQPAPAPGTYTIQQAETVLETSEGAGAADNAEPEWPCCRQYDAPPTVAELEH